MKCPKCSGDMEAVNIRDVEIDRCVSCGGLWFDSFKLERLRREPGAEIIDAKAIARDQDLEEVRRISCPRCGGAGSMIRMVDAEQPHIWYESCGACHGAFLDAGEFQDMREHTLTDYVRDLFAKERR